MLADSHQQIRDAKNEAFEAKEELEQLRAWRASRLSDAELFALSAVSYRDGKEGEAARERVILELKSRGLLVANVKQGEEIADLLKQLHAIRDQMVVIGEPRGPNAGVAKALVDALVAIGGTL